MFCGINMAVNLSVSLFCSHAERVNKCFLSDTLHGRLQAVPQLNVIQRYTRHISGIQTVCIQLTQVDVFLRAGKLHA